LSERYGWTAAEIAAMTMIQVRAYLETGDGEEGQGVPMNHAQLCAYVAAWRARKAKIDGDDARTD